MDVYIIRHGIAVNIGQAGVTCDADRMLSPEGLTKTREAAQGLKALGVGVSAWFSSPLVRAVETADIFARTLGTAKEPILTDALLPWADPLAVLRQLTQRNEPAVALVGHMPHVGDCLAHALSHPPLVATAFKKAAVAAIRFTGQPGPGSARLLWFIPPAALRLMGMQANTPSTASRRDTV